MNHVGFEFAWKVLNDQGVMRALVDANTTSDAEAFRNVRFACVLIHDDAFLPVSDRRAEHLTLVVALLRLTIVFLQNGNTHFIT